MKKIVYILLAILALSCSEKPRFELLSENKTGISFANNITDSDSVHVMNFEYIYNGGGVGVADLNNDGLQDLVFTGNQEPTKVYLNQGGFQFTDISTSLPGLDNGQWYSGVSFVDINSDGWIDIYFTCTAYDDAHLRTNRFYTNQGLQDDGNLLFKENAAELGIADDSYSVHSAFFDYDLDGDLDLYLMNNFVNDRLSASYRPKLNDGTAVSNDDLYRNNGDGTFSNVTLEAGIIYEGFGLGIAIGDVNKDGFPDLYISNDYIANDLLYINQGDGTFRNEIARYLSYQTKSSMGNDMADINNDGYPEIYTLDMLPEYYYKKKQTINGFGYIYYLNDEKFGYEHQYLRNMVHLHNGLMGDQLLPFSEVGQIKGLYQSEWSWSPLFADFDNDGDKDLLIANGYPKDMTDKDWTNYKVEVFNYVASPRHVISRLPAIKVSNMAFENQGDFAFERRDQEWLGGIPSYSYGASFVDLDNDGDLDYVANNLNDPAFIYRNRTMETAKEPLNYLRIKLVGNTGNLTAYGAKLELWYPGGYQFQENYPSRGYISSVDPVIHFGLSTYDRVDSLRITWPATGAVSLITNPEVNQLLELMESGATKASPEPETVDPLFVETPGILEYRHEQDDFIDFYMDQKILPHKFSQVGPSMQLGDLNGDGVDDLIIGSTNSTPTRVFLRNGDRFEETQLPGLTESKPVSEVDFFMYDMDSDGDNDVIALAGGYEPRDPAAFRHILYRNDNGRFTPRELALPPSIGSVLKPFDFDHDGDLDLFVGCRVKMEKFPLADDSWILINQDGEFSSGSGWNINLGMVTDATWSDVDGDGWEDLIVAREWNSLLILKNNEGTGFSNLEFPEIEAKHGIWYSVTAADFDLDGDNDLVVGNLGDNHRFTVTEEFPLRIYAVDLDRNGTLDPISSGYWKDENGQMTEFPINYLDELVGQSTYFMEKFKDYTTFSYASLEEVLDTSIFNRVIYTSRVNTTSSFYLRNEGGSFTWVKLPTVAQLSPISKSLVKDLNGDSYPDLILGGNDHSYDVSTGWFDSNKGIILMSEDTEPLTKVLLPSESGLLLHGMVESLMWIEDQEPMIIAGLNRDSVRVFSLAR